MQNRQYRILVVEDEIIICEDIKKALQSSGFEISGIAHSGEKALSLLESNKVDLVLMDIVLNGRLNGIETAVIIKEQYNIPVVFLTSYSDKITMKRAQEAYPCGYILKPFSEEEITDTINSAMEKFISGDKMN